MESQPPPKRAKKSHHANQLPDICHCERCKGRLIQDTRTIAEHARKYPRRESSPPPAALPCTPPRCPIRGDITNTPRQQLPPNIPPYQPSPPHANNQAQNPGSPSSNGDFGSPRRKDGQLLDNELDLGEGDDRGGQNGWDGRNGRNGGNGGEDGLLPAWEPDGNWFDRLDQLDEEDDLHERVRALDQQDQMGEDDLEDEYDEDFGLLNGGNDDLPVREIPRFQMPEEPELPEPGDDPPDVELGEWCAAFREHTLIRNAYVDALVQKTLYGATHNALAHQLRSAKRTISTHPDVPAEDLAKMAQTIRTAERRLGVSTDDLITTYTLCPKCGRCYSPTYINESDSAQCLNNDCDGELYTYRLLASGSRRRISNRTFPYASPIAWIRHLLGLPGISELVQNWRGEEDVEGQTEPVSCDAWMEDLDPDVPLGDISNGWAWRAKQAALERVENPHTGEVCDESQIDPPLRFSSLPFGFSLSLNTDWFQPTKEGNYSVGACYLVLNNLPRHLRFLRENICLAIVMPGPGEPNSYTLEQIMGPLIDDLLELQQGVRMMVREGDPPVYREQFVHAHLMQHIADLIARIKMGGGAGLRSELNFCLYCHARLSSLSVPDGFLRADFNFRDPEEELSNAYFWKSLETPEDRKIFFDFTGNRFTALHRLPGWYTSTCSPLDAMHLLYQGGMNWICKQILYAPGMLNKCRPGDEDPILRFNGCLGSMWLPGNFSRRPPKFGQTNTRVKADQWKLMSRVIIIPLYMAFRRGDDIPNDLVPRGTRSSTSAKHQARRAKLLHREREKHYNTVGDPDQCPTLEQCFSSRNLMFHYQQVLRFCLAVGIIDKRTISPTRIGFATRMLETVSINYVRNNVPVPPNFHYLMHFEEFLLKFGSVYNTHVWGMERANGIIAHINHNGRGQGIMEGTFMRGWWSYTTLQNLINIYQSIQDPSPADIDIIQDLQSALRGGPGHAQQRGTLMAYIAQCRTAYTRLHGIQEPTQLSNQSSFINLQNHGLYEIILDFCVQKWPRAGIFGPGMPERVYLPPMGAVRHYSYLEHDGLRYGGYNHTSGKGYCYGYIDGRQAVRIEWVLYIEFPNRPRLRSICVLVRPFRRPRVEPRFPWNTWANHLGVSSWLHDEFGPLTAITANRLTGVFALFDIPRTDGRYWVTVALDSVLAEEDEEI